MRPMGREIAIMALRTDISATDAPAGIGESCRLSIRVRRAFREAADARLQSGIDERLYAAMLAFRGRYSEEDRRRFRASDLPEDLFTPLAATKARAAAAQLHEIFSAPGDKPWTLAPTPMPTVPESVAKEAFSDILAGFLEICRATGRIPGPEEMFQYAMNRMDEVHRKEIEWAKIRAERMETLVHDQLVEGGWIDAFSAYVDYLTVYGTAGIRGPTPRVVWTRRVKENRYGVPVFDIQSERRLCFEAVSPWDCYPAPGARKVGDGPLCLRVRFSSEDLWQWTRKSTGGEGSGEVSPDGGRWFRDEVEKILRDHPSGGVSLVHEPYDEVRDLLEDRGTQSFRNCLFEGIEYFGSALGSELSECGIDRDADDGNIESGEYYEIHCIDIDGKIVYCRISPLGMARPFSKGTFYAVPDSWWGGSISERCDSAQRVVNCCLRNLVNNIAVSSGPQFFVKDYDRLMDKSPGALVVRPYKVWAFEAGITGQTDNPIGVLQVPSTMNDILAVFGWAKQQADEDTGIPAYTYGSNVSGGAGRTASGLSMLTEAASRVMKMVVSATDRDIVRDMVRRVVAWNLLWGDDASVKGDCEVNPSGTMGMILREQESNRRKQFLSMAMNPLGLQLFGPKLAVAIAREEAKTLGLPNLDDVLPSKERMEEQEMLQQLQQVNAALSGTPPEGGGGEGMGGGAATAQGEAAQQRVANAPGQVAMEQGLPSAAPPGQVAERRAVA